MLEKELEEEASWREILRTFICRFWHLRAKAGVRWAFVSCFEKNPQYLETSAGWSSKDSLGEKKAVLASKT